jgi:ribosomal protein S18 acetylase RimI-like enzyme
LSFLDYHSNGLTSPAFRKKSKVFEIRQADKSDISDLVELDEECFDSYFYAKTKFGKSDFKAYLRSRKSIFFVAVRDSHLVGYVAGSVRNSEVLSTAHLDSIAVTLMERRQGIGNDLLQQFIQEAKQQDCTSVFLEVAKANEDGLDFFSKRGFRAIADLPEYYGKGLDGILMELSI